MINYVCGFMFSEDGDQVALIRKSKPSWQKGYLNGIGGKIEKDEFMKEAMVREFLEETGVKTVIQDWKEFFQLDGTDYSVKFLVAKGDLSTLKTTTEELVEIIALEELQYCKTIPNLQWLIPMALDTSFTYGKGVTV